MLRENREELYALSARTGATRADAKFDVDGGIGVLLSYASKAKRELPDDTVYVEGPVEALSRDGQFVGQHVLTSRPGVAVQINAFNFPVWGPLEKLAPALLAGLPTLIKPASQTAYLTARLVELIVGLRACCPRVPSRCCAAAPATCSTTSASRTSLSFTGSAATAQRLRGHPGVLARGVHVQRRSRLAQLLDPRPGRRRGHAGVRPVRRPAGHRDDREGRPEVHRDPPRDRARSISSTPSSTR